MGTQNVWVYKSVGTQNCGYLKYMALQKLCVYVYSKFKIVCTKICGYSKFVRTCTQNFNFVGT